MPGALLVAREIRLVFFHPALEAPAHLFDLGTSAPRAPPRSVSSLV